MQQRTRPRCIVIAGPNGAGKTTFAREYLPKVARLIQFVNADLIAQGLSPLDPRLAALAAGRLVIEEINRLATARADFAFESTLSGLTYARQLRTWKAAGYRIALIRTRSEEHTSELQSQSNLVCRLLLEKKKKNRLHISRLRSLPG